MENASKALLIAGAIILAILIISLGMIIYNQAEGATDNLNLSEYEVQAFNKKFSRYEGGSVSGTEVNNLMEAALASNNINVKNETGMYVSVIYPRTVTSGSGNEVTGYVSMGVRTNGGVPSINYSNYYKLLPDAIEDVVNKKDYTRIIRDGQVSYTNSPKYPYKVLAGLTYKVQMLKDDSSGLIGAIFVTKN